MDVYNPGFTSIFYCKYGILLATSIGPKAETVGPHNELSKKVGIALVSSRGPSCVNPPFNSRRNSG